MENLVLCWEVESLDATERTCAMYCFKSCSVNNN